MALNMENDHETAFWQPFFEQNAWILSQLFHAPVMFFLESAMLVEKEWIIMVVNIQILFLKMILLTM